ncbi:conserved domain-containing [Fusarium sporotrichioides]|uniref:Conserved domain-containing n=1 Tax=Fusarium sporotrichioides TaxID=5514 RepID=A0A395SK61_FUSSP|nr:conserved domain-containing [Fusarium sporotrichioides]
MSIKRNSTTLVDLGAYKLEVTVHGPPRRAHNPIVIIIPDIGSSIKEWTAVTEMLANSMAVVRYERAGYGQSENIIPGNSRAPAALAMELHMLLRAAKIAPPYIMVCHSRGASILQEFTKLRNLAQFKGFVFVDVKTGPLDQSVQAKLSGLDSLKLCYGDCHRLGESAWQALLDEEARAGHQAAAEREIAEYHIGGENSAVMDPSSVEQPEYGRVPLVVLQADVSVDARKICGEEDRAENGTEAEVNDMRDAVERLNELEVTRQKNLLKLSARSQYESSRHYLAQRI